MFSVCAAYSTHQGLQKANNEDNLFCDGHVLDVPAVTAQASATRRWRKNICIAVFDGLGGLPDGEKASFAAADALRRKVEGSFWSVKVTQEWMENTLYELNEKVYSLSAKAGYRLGTTAAAIVVGVRRLIVGNVGDSRVYRFWEDTLEQLSVDHSDRDLLEELGIEGRRPSLMQYVGMGKEGAEFHPSIAVLSHRGEGRYLLCSDGLTDMVADAEIAEVCRQTSAAADCANRLVDLAIRNGGKDNVTVIVCDLGRNKSAVQRGR